MPIKIIRQDITKIKCDAIVDPTDVRCSHGGGADADIHETAGVELYHACAEQGFLEVGKAIITPGFALPCKYVIHTVGPRWHGGENGEEEILRNCYRESLKLAMANKCKSLAIPLIASGVFGFPKDKVLKIAVDEISNFLLENELLVYIVVFDKASYQISEELFDDVAEYIDDNYVNESGNHYLYNRRIRRSYSGIDFDVCRSYSEEKALAPQGVSLEDMLSKMDDNFAVTLLKLVDVKGITDVECYKKANVSKQTWYKIMNEKNYKPSKNTVIAFAIALKLTLEETNHLLATVGFALSKSNKFDIIIEYFLINGEYNIFTINETLFKFDQVCLGT